MNDGSSFATLLQRFRFRSGLTQEALAEAAGISPRGISDLERGVRRYPRRDTLALLSRALQLSDAERAELEAAASRPHRPRERPTATDASPYRGLRSFREEDAKFFRGREAFTETLVRAIHHRNFVAVVGPSGVGKSSVVYAGLLPRIRQSSEPAWSVVDFRPGRRAFHSMAAGLLTALDPDINETERLVQVNRLARGLLDGTTALEDVADRIRTKTGAGRLLLVVDQMEELYTLSADETEARAFVECLLAASNGMSLLTVVITLRADFLGRALGLRSLADRLQDAQVNLSTMTLEEAERAVMEPAHALGVDFEPGLVSRILEDLNEEPGALPLLEFVLTELWEERSQDRLVHAAYEAMGGVQGALAARADEVLGWLSSSEQDEVRRLMLHLIQPGVGSSDTRRRSTLGELGSLAEAPLGWLTDARLLVTGRDETTGEETVEIAHEALIQHWGRLREWVDRDREFLLWRLRLASAVEQWESVSRDDDSLLRGHPLAEAQRWYEERSDDIWPEGRAYVERSVALQELAAKAAHRRRLVLLGSTAVTVAVVLGLAIFALIQWRAARSAEDESELALAVAESREMAGRANSVALTQPQLALLLAAEAYNRSPTFESRDAIARGLASLTAAPAYASTVLAGHRGGVHDVEFTPDGGRIVSGSFDRTVQVWDLESGEAVGPAMEGHSNLVYAVAVSPDGSLIASAGFDGTLRIWDALTGNLLGEPITGHTGWVYDVAFSPDGRVLASAGADHSIRLWNVENRQSLGSPLTGHTDTVYKLAFSPDAGLLASASADETVRLWRVDSQLAVGEPLRGHSSWVHSVAFSPDGALLASAGVDGTVRLWDTMRGESEGPPLQAGGAWLYSVAFSPDGGTLAVSNSDGVVQLWDIEAAQPAADPLLAHVGIVHSVSFSPDGSRLVSAGADGLIRVWDLTARQNNLETIAGHEDWVFGIAFSPDGETLASGSFDGTVRLWDAESRRPLGQPLEGHTDWVSSVAFSPDGRILASGSTDHSIRLWDPETGGPAAEPLQGHTGWVYTVAFSPDGRLLASASGDGSVRLWDVQTGEQAGPSFTSHQDEVLSVAFSPDGKLLASAGRDGRVMLRDTETLQLVNDPLIGHNGPVTGIAFSPDGKLLASGSLDQTVMLWDVATGDPFGQPMAGHAGWVYGVAFSADGTILASASNDGTIRLWDVESSQPLGDAFTGHAGAVSTVVFSPDGKRFASAGQDATIRLWPYPSIAAACARAVEPFPAIPPYLQESIDAWTCATTASEEVLAAP